MARIRLRRLWICFLGTFSVALAAIPPAFGSPAQLTDAIGIVLDPTTLQRDGSLAEGQIVTLYVVTDYPDGAPSQSMLAYQFGVDVDPRLLVIARTAHPQANFVDHVVPDDWRVGLGDCVALGAGTVVLATYQVVLPPGTADSSNLRIGLRGLTNGEPMMWSRCNDPGWLTTWNDAGGCVLNPTPPSIVRFAGAPAVLVEGRPFALSWETFGASAVLLNGAATQLSGRAPDAPTQDTTYELRAQAAGGAEATRTFGVTVLRQPRIVTFTAERFDVGGTELARLAWDVLGADRVSISGLGDVASLSGALVPIPDPPAWVMSASNEWGLSQQTVTLGPVEGTPPVISDFYGVPEPFEAGQPVTLRWGVAFVDQVEILPDIGVVEPVGERQVTPPATAVYTLTATNADGTRTRSFVAHQLPAHIEQFTADPDTIFDPATPVTLSWQTQSALELRVEPGVGPLPSGDGQMTVVPGGATSYRLVASNSESSDDAFAPVAASTPLVEIEVSTPTPFGNEPFTITVRIVGAASATLEPGFGSIDPAGTTVTTSITATTTFTVRATNPFGTTSSLVTIVPQVPFVFMSSTPTVPSLGDSVTLNVSILGAVSATLEPGFGAIDPHGGAFRVLADAQRTYTCTATNVVGTTTSQHTITPKLPSVTLTANPLNPFIDQDVFLTVATQNATSATLEPGFGSIPAIGGIFTTHVDTTTVFTATAYLTGTSVSKSVTVTPKLPQVGLAASTTQPYPTQPITLTVTLRGAVSATLEPGFGSIPVVGTNQFHPTVTQPTTFMLTARNKMGVSTAQVLVTPQPPYAALGASNLSPYPTQPINLTATVLGATSVTLLPGIGDIPLLGGVFQVTVPTTTTYTLTAVNQVGQTVRQVTVTPRAPLISSFAASPPRISTGQSSTLSWQVNHADSLQIQPVGFSTTQLTGSLQVTPPGTTTYTLRAFNTAGLNAQSVIVTVAPFEILAFTASPSTIVLGETVTLAWEVSGVADVSIDGIGPVAMSGNLQVHPTSSRTYTLRATYGTDADTRDVSVEVHPAPPLWLSWSAFEAPGVRPDLVPLQPFDFHVLALDPPGGIQAYEFAVDLPPCLIVSDQVIYPQPGAIDFGVGEDNFIVGTSGLCMAGAVLPLVRTTAIAMQASCFDAGSQVALQPATPSSFEPPAPGYLTCGADGVLHAFQASPPLSLHADESQYPPVIAQFVAQPTDVGPGEPSALSWQTLRATSLTIQPGDFTGLPEAGTLAVNPAASTVYTLTASNALGTVSAQAAVVRLPFKIESFTATPALVAPGQAVTLAWRVVGTANVSIDLLGSQPLQGSLVVHPLVTTTYTLRVRQDLFERVATTTATVQAAQFMPGTLALSWSPLSIPGIRPPIEAFRPFTFYVVTADPPVGIEAFECALVPPLGMLVAGGRFPNPSATDFGVGEDNWIVGTGGICYTGAFVSLIRYEDALFLSTPLPGSAIWLTGSTPSSFASGYPGYLACNSPGDLRTFRSGPAFYLVGDGGGNVPVLDVEVAAQPHADGIEVAWRVTPSATPDRIDVRRAAAGYPEVTVAVLLGSQARSEGAWLDASTAIGARYTYRVALQVSGQQTLSPPVDAVRTTSGDQPPVAMAAPHAVRLLPNLPNPFNPRTELRFMLEQPGDVLLELFDGAGRRVWSVDLPNRPAGDSSIVWDGRDEHGRDVVSGVYRVRATERGSGASDARALTLVR